jgi:hypothetical protein
MIAIEHSEAPLQRYSRTKYAVAKQVKIPKSLEREEADESRRLISLIQLLSFAHDRHTVGV